jgi:hypothetical protein
VYWYWVLLGYWDDTGTTDTVIVRPLILSAFTQNW